MRSRPRARSDAGGRPVGRRFCARPSASYTAILVSHVETDAKWQQNADEIAGFLSAANPNRPKAVLAGMMKAHLSTTTKDVVAGLGGKWDEDVAAFDEVSMHILKMADALADGIIRQFPARFR